MDSYYHSPYKDATPAQRQLLKSMGITRHLWLSMADADRLIKENRDRWAELPPTDGQKRYQQWRGRWREGMNRGEATELIARIKDGSDLTDQLPPDPAPDEPEEG
jgi:hypothetical protein